MSVVDTAALRATAEAATPTRVQMPDEPCVVISDGECIVVASDRTCEPVRQWALTVGPIGRAVMVARLRAFADQIESATTP